MQPLYYIRGSESTDFIWQISMMIISPRNCMSYGDVTFNGVPIVASFMWFMRITYWHSITLVIHTAFCKNCFWIMDVHVRTFEVAMSYIIWCFHLPSNSVYAWTFHVFFYFQFHYCEFLLFLTELLHFFLLVCRVLLTTCIRVQSKPIAWRWFPS